MDNKKVENKKQMSNKKKFWVGMSALAAVGAITATVAWFTSSHQFVNEFHTPRYSIVTQELFDKEAAANVYPGETVEADVSVTNTGDMPVLVRIKYIKKDTEAYGDKGYPEDVAGLASAKGVNLDNIKDDGWTINYDGTDKFEFVHDKSENGEDLPTGSYYYKGILKGSGGKAAAAENIAAHIDSLQIASTYNSTTNFYSYRSGKDQWSEPSQEDNEISNTGKRITTSQNDVLKDLNVKAVVETIQATDKSGNELTNMDTAQKVHDAWANLK